LHEFPWKAALRLEPENAYLWRKSDDFKLAEMVERKTPEGAKIFSLTTVANAYAARDIRVTWQSAEADTLFDALRLAALDAKPQYEWWGVWPIDSFPRLRVRLPALSDSECDFSEIRVYSGDELVYTSPHWTVRAWPNSWEAPLALDGNPATRWRTWQPVRAGTYFEIRFDHPQRVSSLLLNSHSPPSELRPEIYGMAPTGNWRALGPLLGTPRPRPDLRFDATRALRSAGYRYLLVPTGAGGAAPIGNAIVGQEAEWGLELVEKAGPYRLWRVK
ncbi:MAG: hypothetical protein JO099_18795, partial [Acidobacteriia bacterium]|nr:hypothetical protein [Terriglobia bacterium]